MLVISRSGAAGLKPENTIAAIRAGLASDADILHVDVRLTADAIPILYRSPHTYAMNRKLTPIRKLTLKQIRKQTAGSDRPIVTLKEALEQCGGKLLLNIELRHKKSAQTVIDCIKENYITSQSDWQSILLSSHYPGELKRARKANNNVPLALLHSYNPFVFIAHHKRLELSAVGFHRLYCNQLALEIARRAGIFTYAYTVNRPLAAITLSRKGVDAVMSDVPDEIIAHLR